MKTYGSAPAYDRVVPIKGWSRYSGDSAGSLKEWKRWWMYIRLKQPVIMQWIDDLILRIYPGNEVCRALYVKGIYEPNYAVLINKFLSKNGVFIDVGANMGYYSLLASKVVGKDGCIIAIEPSSRDYDRLVDNVENNDLTRLIFTYNFAVFDKASGSVDLSIACEERSSINTAGAEFSFKSVDKIRTENVKVISIDALSKEISLSRLDVLKLDIEGYELKALQGAEQTLKKFRPVIMLGVNENSLRACGASREEVQEILKNFGYRIYKIVEVPKFALELVENLSKESEKVVFCLHESVTPPELPQSEEKTFSQKIEDFFLK
jgi:FkbM family methyltransferase